VKHRAVVFDLFGTLITGASRRDQEAFLEELAGVAGATPVEFTRWFRETYAPRQTGQFPTSEAWAAYILRCLGLPGDAARAARYEEFTRRTFVPRQDAVATLGRVRTSGRTIGLISDCGPNVPGVFRASALAGLVDAPLFSCETGIKKPDPRVYHLACQRLGVSHADCLYVGDGGSRELTGAASVGMTAVQLRTGAAGQDAPFQDDADDWRGPAVTSLSDVLVFIK